MIIILYRDYCYRRYQLRRNYNVIGQRSIRVVHRRQREAENGTFGQRSATEIDKQFGRYFVETGEARWTGRICPPQRNRVEFRGDEEADNFCSKSAGHNGGHRDLLPARLIIMAIS